MEIKYRNICKINLIICIKLKKVNFRIKTKMIKISKKLINFKKIKILKNTIIES